MADLIRYDLLVQDALRGVVRQVLTEVAQNGLQGEHHFFVTFKTATPGLRLSNRMRERYPDEMTVILQHQFWGLSVTDAGFEVGLSFNGEPERLYVPFSAITMFQDPSVTFGLKFDPKETASPADGTPKPVAAEPSRGKRALATVETSVPSRLGLERQPKQDDKPASDRSAAENKGAEKSAGGAAKVKPVLAKVPDAADDGKDDTAATKVVSIDAFRKKP